jgi:PAS domain S-box-containing protein
MEAENNSNIDKLNQKIRELQEREERFRTIVECSNEAIVVTQDEMVKYHNLRFGDLTGYTLEEIPARNFLEFVHPEDRETVMREYQTRVSGEQPASEYLTRIVTKDSQVKYVSVSSALIDWGGKPASLTMLTDITDLKETEKRLLKSEERYQLAVAGSAAGLWDWDIPTNELHISDRFKELLGYEPAELNLTLEELLKLLHPDYLESVRMALDKHLKDRITFNIDYRLQTKSGEFRWFHARGQALWNEAGEAIRMSGSLTDITLRKMAEEKLKRSEERFRRLMEYSPLGISIWAPDGKIIQVNRAWMRTWDLNESEAARLIAKHNWLTDPQSKELGIMPLVERAFAGDSVVLPPVEYSGVRRTKELGLGDIKPRTMWLQVHMYSFKDEQGAVENVVAINVDITELKKAEQETLVQREALARMDRATRMGQLTGSIAHELNQPLTGILSNAQAAELMLKSKKWKREDYVEIIADIIADTKRAGDVIRNLRELYSEHKGEHTPVDINSVAEEAIQLMQSDFVIKQVEIISELVPSIPLVNGNKFQLQQVLVNLIMNGEQAMSNMTQDDRKLHIATTFDEYEVKLWVDDFGRGIEEDKIDHIFEPLATWKPGGTGMGLAISNSIIEAHGGKMWAENRSEGGACVGFTLPVIKKDKKK